MAVIYLTHPVHGAKVACSDIEADFDQQHGWERYNPDQEIEPDADTAPVARRGRRKKTEESVESNEGE